MCGRGFVVLYIARYWWEEGTKNYSVILLFTHYPVCYGPLYLYYCYISISISMLINTLASISISIPIFIIRYISESIYFSLYRCLHLYSHQETCLYIQIYVYITISTISTVSKYSYRLLSVYNWIILRELLLGRFPLQRQVRPPAAFPRGTVPIVHPGGTLT